MSRAVTWVCVLWLFLGIALPSQAHISVGATITIVSSGSPVTLYQFAEAKAGTEVYYDVVVAGYIYRNNVLQTCICPDAYADGNPKAEKTVSTAKVANSQYVGLTHYYALAYFKEIVNSTIIYDDPSGFSLINPNPNIGGSGNFYGSSSSTVVTTQLIHLGSSWVGDDTFPPVISAIVVTGSPVRGGSGYVEVYGTNLRQYAGGTTASISGSGVTASVIYQNPANPGQVNLSYSISSSASTGNRNLTLTTPDGTSNSKTFTIYDHTPVIDGMPHNYWGAGGSTVVEIYGKWFGINPQVNVTGNGVVTQSVVIEYKNDTQINVRIPISDTAPNGPGTITVTASNMDGGLFQQQPGGGGAQTSANASILSKSSFSMKLEKIGFAINAGNNYSEDSEIRVTAVRNANGAALQGWTGIVPIRETTTPIKIYTQNGGSLPSTVTIPYGSGGATSTLLAKSLAGPKDSQTKPDDAKISTTVTSGSSGFSVYGGSDLVVPQWIVSPGTIDSGAGGVCTGTGNESPGTPYDWVQRRMKDIRTSASGDKSSVLSHVKCYGVKSLTGGAGFTFWVRGNVSPIAIDPYSDIMRVDSNGGSYCQTARSRFLTNTYLHEARHTYQAYRASVTNNDKDGDFLPANPHPIAPTSTMVDSNTPRTVCDGPLVPNKTYLGDAGGSASFDQPVGNADLAWQYDAFLFADTHD